MKIENGYKPSAFNVTHKPSPASTPTNAATQAQEAVSLSQAAGSIQSSEGAPVNKARIQEIKQAIAEGRFKINPDAIADRLIDSARDLLKDSGQRQA